MNDENDTEYPLVSCIMLAGKSSIKDVLLGIECFKKQTWPYKELIIVNNAKSHFDATSLNINVARDVFLIDTPFQLSTGMARNYGIAAANGQILAQFDPDYWFAPDRIKNQVMTLAENNSHISILNETLAYSFTSGRATYQTNIKKAILNTMVFIRPKGIDYPNVEKQEELGLITKMQNESMTIVSTASPELACKFYSTDIHVKKPINCGISADHFKIIKQVVKTHHAQ